MLAHLGKHLARICAALMVLTLGATLSPEQPAATAAAPEAKGAGYEIRAMSFNILTASMAPGGAARANSAANQVQERSREVVAFQEVHRSQLKVLRKRLPRFKFYPRRSLGNYSSAIQLAWKADVYQAKKKGVIYRPFLGHQRAIPYVKLKHRKTGRVFYVVAIHNSPGGQERERDISTTKEIKLIKRLEAKGDPVLVMGDMNERVEFCQRVAKATDLVSVGGTKRKPCPVPPKAGPDWMMATWTGTKFSDHRKVYNGISDHPVLVGNVWVEPAAS
ncbi:endonuclease/exonuclease/phosphatase family protein [Nocardioides humi]|uniref:Endonuclease/exonuclease/phosphatase domain-containing protein n=1 Tax=Nocardioides humi TaxID=449461 RepID=A0ABN1ZP22_9ACTN|nr:endonuclease/exonuclease/phosphatase family protein [Nocardioides humi]